MIRISKTSEEEWWGTEEYLKEFDRISNGHKVSLFKHLKTLLMGKAEVPTKPKE